MGYVGQHLVSVVTGFSGGKSGARGYDLLLPGGNYGEIKTCYRVDQLGKCRDCGEPVSAMEDVCSNCGLTNIERKSDSKWLITIRNDHEFEIVAEPQFYYFALFEFDDYRCPTTSDIYSTIYRVDTKHPGFILCMIDYYKNFYPISHTAFNLWPHSVKFQLMEPMIIYKSVIRHDDTIETLLFPDATPEVPELLALGADLGRQRTITSAAALQTLESVSPRRALDFNLQSSVYEITTALHESIIYDEVPYSNVCRKLAINCYRPLIAPHVAALPRAIKQLLGNFELGR